MGEVVKVAYGAGTIVLNTKNQAEEIYVDLHILLATSLGASVGKTIKTYIQSDKKPTTSVSFMGIKFSDPAPVMRAFSSKGPSIVGLDVTDPAGASMSCPNVSGIATLLKYLHKDWSPAAIKSALMTTAYTLNNKGAPISDMASDNKAFATPFAFGSDHVNPVSVVTNVGKPQSGYAVKVEQPNGVSVTFEPRVLKFEKKLLRVPHHLGH
ncbi:hypothetical protein JHK86_003624 [Glycine max]|nr:hypothetical protein JHK86_003624 [Glycine max]